MALHEYRETVATLWDTTQKFAQKYPQYVAKDSGLHFLTDNPEKGVGGTDWNLCHFWSNFEIGEHLLSFRLACKDVFLISSCAPAGDLRFWRGEAYQKYFEWLDQSGGFFYERWGDAPVHSVAAMLFLDRSRVHHFNDIGYFHVPWDHCPSNRKVSIDSCSLLRMMPDTDLILFCRNSTRMANATAIQTRHSTLKATRVSRSGTGQPSCLGHRRLIRSVLVSVPRIVYQSKCIDQLYSIDLSLPPAAPRDATFGVWALRLVRSPVTGLLFDVDAF